METSSQFNIRWLVKKTAGSALATGVCVCYLCVCTRAGQLKIFYFSDNLKATT